MTGMKPIYAEVITRIEHCRADISDSASQLTWHFTCGRFLNCPQMSEELAKIKRALGLLERNIDLLEDLHADEPTSAWGRKINQQ